MGRLDGKVVIITGAARGMGRATAAACRAEGAALVVSDRDAAVEELGVPFVVGDVADPSLAAQAVELALETHGAVHGLAHVAGAHLNGDITEVTDEEWARILAINLTGPMVWSRAVVPAMTAAGGGSIILVASINASVAHPRSVAYTSSKAGVLGLMRSLALDGGPANIRANTISPGSIATEMLLEAAARHPLGDKALQAHRQANPLGRLGEPSEIANTCVFLLSDEAPYITGADFKVDGGRTART
jgi:NAD(P)-dependent dehydrogenase (short-subunit alcohol dehydrogenase family)